MVTLKVGKDGSIHLPDVIRDRYCLTPDCRSRIIRNEGRYPDRATDRQADGCRIGRGTR